MQVPPPRPATMPLVQKLNAPPSWVKVQHFWLAVPALAQSAV